MLIDAKDIESFCDALRRAGKKIVFTNGCFDIIHAGHVRYLTEAHALGDILVLGLNSDASVRRIKGNSRPINGELDRAAVADALKAVDYVTIFEEDTAERMVEIVKPDIYVKGGDYDIESLPEARVAAKYGGKTVLLSFLPGHSTTGMIKKITETNYTRGR